jgi:hypothetical protein
MGPELGVWLQKIWHLCTEGAEVRVRIPHPRHDLFLQDLGYVRGLLPETFAQLNPQTSPTGLAGQLGVRYEILETSFSLDPYWQTAVDEGKVTYEEIPLIAKQASNVIARMEIKMQIKKSLWIETQTSPVTEAMKKQLQEQMEGHRARGDEQAAAVIQKFLDGVKKD